MAKLWIPLTIGAAALTGMFFVFMNGASPYVTVAEAKVTAGDRLHLKGAIVDGSLDARPREGKVFFTLKDEKGDLCKVVYNGPPPSNMGEAKEVVAIGRMKGEHFESDKLQLKCPSKYESENKTAEPEKTAKL